MSRRIALSTGCRLLLLLGVAAPLRAQAPARLAGRIYDATTGTPVALAEVSAGDLRAVSAEDGSFHLGSVPPGALAVEVRRLGYTPWRGIVPVTPGLERRLTVALAPLPLRLDSLIVRAEPGGIAIAGDELARRGRDLGRALDGWEGVVVRRNGGTGPAAPQVRGGGPDEVLVLVDGFAVNDPLTGRADLSTIPTGDVERVTLVPGARTARAGRRAVAGMLLVETRRAERPEGAVWAGSHGSRGARLAAPVALASVAVTTDRGPTEFAYDVPEVRGGGEGVRLNAGGSQHTATVRMEEPVSLLLRATMSDRGLPGTTTNPTPFARADDRSVLLGLTAGDRLRWKGSLQWLETRAADSAPPTGSGYDSYTHGVGVEGGVEYEAPVAHGPWTGRAAVAADVRGDRFGGDGVRSGASFTHLGFRAGGAVHRGSGTVWSLVPAVRLDSWTGSASPRASLRLDAGVQRRGTSATLGIGSGVTPPVLADLLFREDVGVRLNPDLRPERVRWEVEGGVRYDLSRGRGSLALRGFYGRVADLVVWAPDFRFIWSPHNFDVLRRGGELTVAARPIPSLALDASAAYAAVTYDRADGGGTQVQYRPRVTYSAAAAWSPNPWRLDLRWHRIGRRYPNAAGTNARPPISLLDASLERRVTQDLVARAEVRDLADARAEFIAGYPTPGRTFTLALELTLP